MTLSSPWGAQSLTFWLLGVFEVDLCRLRSCLAFFSSVRCSDDVSKGYVATASGRRGMKTVDRGQRSLDLLKSFVFSE